LTCFQLKLQAKEVVRERGLEKVKLEDLVTVIFYCKNIVFNYSESILMKSLSAQSICGWMYSQTWEQRQRPPLGPKKVYVATQRFLIYSLYSLRLLEDQTGPCWQVVVVQRCSLTQVWLYILLELLYKEKFEILIFIK
jgi:hypothetical protein